MLARLNPTLKYFTPPRALTPHEALQLRVLVSGTLIGLVVAAASAGASTPADTDGVVGLHRGVRHRLRGAPRG
jgi:hypothetical protein